METEDEWAFINSETQKRNVGKNEWYISLKMKQSEWKWISNHNLAFTKWQPNQPSKDGRCVVMAKNWPNGTQGLWNDLQCTFSNMLICEYNKGNYNCMGIYRVENSRERGRLIKRGSAHSFPQ
jgi:hypothetical protein